MHGWGTQRSWQVLPRTSVLHTQISMQRAQSCRSCSRSRGRQSAALEVGDNTTSDTHDVIRVRTEVVVPCSRRCPHFVVLQQVRINKHTQLCAVTKGRHAAVGLGNPSSTRCCHTKSLTKTTLVTGSVIPSTASLNGTTLLTMRAGSRVPDETSLSTGLAVAQACTRPIS